MSIEHIRALKAAAGLPKEKKKYTIPKVSEKKKKQIAEGKQLANSGELDRWFKERRDLMTGICENCGGPSCKNDDEYYKFSVAHLLPKAYFKSIATHPDNWIELCFFGKSCHTNLDSGSIDLIELNCFSTVIDKFVRMYPAINQKERRRIPEVLLQYIEIEK